MSLPSSFFDLLKTLTRSPSVTGAEHSFFRLLQRELEERGARVTWYEGVLVAQGNMPDTAMFSAHVDRHGLMCTGPNEFQYAAFVAGRRSDLLGNSVSESFLEKVAGRFIDTQVYAYEPWSGVYRGAGRIAGSYVCPHRKNLIFEVEGLNHLVAGTPVAFVDRVTRQENIVSGQLDNVLTVAHLVHLFEAGFQGTAFFTSQEESGSSWRFLLEWFRRSQCGASRLVVVDTSPFPDLETVAKYDVVLRRRDANAEFDPEFTRSLEQLCIANDICHVFKDEYIEELNAEAIARGEKVATLGSTELGRIINASDGYVQGATLQIPTTGYHTMSETATIRSNQVFAQLLQHLGRCI